MHAHTEKAVPAVLHVWAPAAPVPHTHDCCTLGTQVAAIEVDVPPQEAASKPATEEATATAYE
jgi:hypothetical protein